MHRSIPASTAALLWVLAATGCDRGGGTASPEDGTEATAARPDDPVDAAAQKMAAHDPAGALAVVDRGLEKDPENPELWFAQGVALQALGRADEAVVAWEKTLERKPDAFAALHGLAAIHLERQEFARAQARLEEAIAIQPEFADAHYNLALALLGQGNGAGAMEALQTAARLAPQDPDVRIQLAELHLAAGQAEQAIASARQATEVAPQDGLAWATYGRVLLRTKDAPAAVAAYERAQALSPDDLNVRLGLAQAWLKVGKAAEAAGALEELSKVAGDSGLVWLEWGTALAQQGQWDAALVKFDQALERSPTLVVAHVRRIGALVDADRCKDAKAALDRLRKMEGSASAVETAQTAVARCGK